MEVLKSERERRNAWEGTHGNILQNKRSDYLAQFKATSVYKEHPLP